MSKALSAFLCVALGHAQNLRGGDIEPAMASWAQETVSQLGSLGDYVWTDRFVGQPPGAEKYLRWATRQALLFVADEFAQVMVGKDEEQPGAVVCGVGPVRTCFHLEDGLPVTSIPDDAVGSLAFSTFQAAMEKPLSNPGPIEFDPDMQIRRRLGGMDRQSLSTWLENTDNAPHDAILAIDAIRDELESWNHSHHEHLSSACARRVAALLYEDGPPPGSRARLLLAAHSARFADTLDNIRIAGANASAGALAAAEQTPDAITVASAFATPLGIDLGLDGAGRVKATLASTYGLSSAGWKLLVKHASTHPTFFLDLAIELNSAGDRLSDMRCCSLGVNNPLPDGSWPIHKQLLAREVCACATMCANIGAPFALASDLFLQWANPPYRQSHSFISLLSYAPIAWREIQTDEHLYDWTALLDRHGLSAHEHSLLNPVAFAKLATAGWTPEGEAEQIFASLERDRSSRAAKGATLIASVLGQARKMGIDHPKFNDDMANISDFMCEVELGFWEQAPDRLDWGWVKKRSDEWHELVIARTAAASSWLPILDKPVELGAWTARELVDGKELFEEGKTQRHCVSSYAGSCSAGHCRIYALSHSNRLHRATLEIRLDYPEKHIPDTPKVPIGASMGQLKGFANSTPGVGAKIAAAKILELVQAHCDNHQAPTLRSASKPSTPARA